MNLVSTSPAEGTAEWWLLKLTKKLAARNLQIREYDSYYEGDHNIAFSTPKFKEAFGSVFRDFSDNWCALICDAPEERLSVEGFRYGDDTKGDKKAWRIWQENELDSMSQMAHLEAMINCESYALVWPDEKNPSLARITIEHPSECIVQFVTGSSRTRAAALKQWTDDDGYLRANVYLPDGIYKFRSTRKVDSKLYIELAGNWAYFEPNGEVWPVPNKFGAVPVVPLMNKPRLLKGGVSEIRDVIPVQDAVNKVLLDMLVTGEFTAAPQRYAIGWPVQKDQNNQPINPVIDQLVSRMLMVPKDVELGQFPQADLTSFKQVVDMLVWHLASRTRTPPHYFYLEGNFPSGEAIKSAETGLVAKVRRKMKHFGEGWEEVMRLAFTVEGDKKRSQERASETVWKDPESRTESEHIDAVGKKRALLKIPLEQAWADAGYSPQQIERMKQQLLEESDWLPASMASDAGTRGTQIAAGAAADKETLDPDDPNATHDNGSALPV